GGVVFEVGVLHDHDVAGGGGEAGAHGGALALIFLVVNDLIDQRCDFGAQQVAGAVARAVVHDDDLFLDIAEIHGANPVNQRADGVTFVVAGDDDGEFHGLRIRYGGAVETEAHFRHGGCLPILGSG